MFVDNYIPSNGIDYGGGLVQQFAGRSFDPGLRRPYYDKYDRPCVTVNTGRWTTEKGERKQIRERRLVRDLILDGVIPPVFNATALRKEEWIELDRAVLKAARYRLRAVSDLAAAAPYGGFNGMGKMMLEWETMSDPGEAIVSMTGTSQGRNDSAEYQLEGVPLPITHVDFHADSRTLAISRNSGSPIDTVNGEAAGRRIGEMVEKILIGNVQGITYGGNSTQVGGYGRTSKVYGYINFTPRLTKTNIATPTGLNAATTLSDVLACLDQLKLNKFFGPFMIYHSNDWDKYMDNDYILTGGNVATQTLRNRLRAIEGVMDVRRLDMLFATKPVTDPGSASYRGPGGEGVGSSGNPFTLIFVQMTSEVAQMVNGLDITTLQWELQGGMLICFKVMTIQVGRLRADKYGNCGILQATTS